MTNSKAGIPWFAAILVSLLAWTAAYAQITPSGDAYTNSADPTTKYGANTLLDVDGASQTTYIQFNLASIPSDASVSQATLKLYVNDVTTAGSFNVDYVNGSWSESTIDHSNAPPLGSTIASNVAITTADKNQYILINVTSAVQAWLNGSETNNGIALVANSTFNASFDSKENTTTSHPAELDIVFAGGGSSGGPITGVTAGTDLTGGGTSGTVTLNLDTTKVPQLNAPNTFEANQTVYGNVSVIDQFSANTVVTNGCCGGVTSTMTGSGNGIAAITGSATGTGAAGFTYGVFGQSASNTGRGVFGNSTGAGGIGVIGENNNGPGFGVVGKALAGSTGFGVYGQSVEPSSTGTLYTYTGGVWGDSGHPSSDGDPYVTGVLGTADDANAGSFLNNSPSNFATLAAFAINGQTDPLYVANYDYGTYCVIDQYANLNCVGTSSSVVPLDGGKRKVALSAIESPSNWFEDFGSAQLISGVAVVQLDPEFIQTVNTEKDYKVFPVPNGDCKGLYVASKTADSFEVRELGGGTSNINFDYRITAIRRNYETVRFAGHTNDPDPKQMLERMRAHKTKASSVPVTVRPTLPSVQAESHN